MPPPPRQRAGICTCRRTETTPIPEHRRRRFVRFRGRPMSRWAIPVGACLFGDHQQGARFVPTRAFLRPDGPNRTVGGDRSAPPNPLPVGGAAQETVQVNAAAVGSPQGSKRTFPRGPYLSYDLA